MIGTKLLVSLLLSLSLVTSAFAENRTRSIASVPSSRDANLRVAELVSAIDRQADEVFRDFRSTHPDVPLSILKHVQREAAYRLKQMNVMTDILKASGPTIATSIVATEILTTFVLAPLAGAMGKPALAGVFLVAPWGLIAGAGTFAYEVLKIRVKIARRLGLRSLGSLDRFRADVVGYDLKNRVSSIIYENIEGDIGTVEFEVLRKSMNFEAAQTPAVTIAELEEFLKASSEGEAYLRKIYMEKLDPAFYSALLLRFIDESDELTDRLTALIRERGEAVVTGPSAVRRHLLAAHDVQIAIDREIKALQIQHAGLKKRVKAGEITSHEAKAAKVRTGAELVRLRLLRRSLMHHEYTVLLDAVSNFAKGTAIEDLNPVPQRASDLVDIAAQIRTKPSETVEAARPRPVTPSIGLLSCSALFAN